MKKNTIIGRHSAATRGVLLLIVAALGVSALAQTVSRAESPTDLALRTARATVNTAPSYALAAIKNLPTSPPMHPVKGAVAREATEVNSVVATCDELEALRWESDSFVKNAIGWVIRKVNDLDEQTLDELNDALMCDLFDDGEEENTQD